METSFKAMEYELSDILKLVRRRGYVLLILLILGTMFSVYMIMQKPKVVYQASTTLIVGNLEINQIQQNQRYINTYCALAGTSFIAEKTSNKLNNTIPFEVIQSAVTAVPQPNTQFMDIRITWGNPNEAVQILNALSEVFIGEMKNFYPTCNIEVIDKVKELKMIILSKRKYAALGPIGAIIIAFFIIFGLDFLDNTIRTEEDVMEYLKLPVIAEVPKHMRISQLISMNTVKDKHSAVIESLRTLRTNVEFISACDNLKVILITSGGPGEGKSITASGLASMLALDGKNTILVDCDLRNPNIHNIFNLSNNIGLTCYLAGKSTLSEIMSKSDNERLTLLTSGIIPPNSAELLSTENMKKFINILRENFDYIILDTSPSGLFTDTQILSQQADGCVMVVASGDSDKKFAMKAKENIQNVNGRIIGVVLNKVKSSSYRNYYCYNGGSKWKVHKRKVIRY